MASLRASLSAFSAGCAEILRTPEFWIRIVASSAIGVAIYITFAIAVHHFFPRIVRRAAARRCGERASKRSEFGGRRLPSLRPTHSAPSAPTHPSFRARCR